MLDIQWDFLYTYRALNATGSQLSWESICLTSRGSQVRALQVPLFHVKHEFNIWRCSSVGQSIRFIPVVSRVRISPSLFFHFVPTYMSGPFLLQIQFIVVIQPINYRVGGYVIKSGLKNQPTPNNLYRSPVTLSQNRSILPHC